MLRKLELLAPSFIAATLMLGISTPAFADVLPPEDREDPPDTKPKLYEPPPEEPKAEEPKAEEPKAEEPKADAKKADAKSSGCSIDDGDDRNVLGLAALVLVISGVALRRRRSPRHG